MQVTTLSFFRFEGIVNKIWALVHMGLARGPFRRLQGIRFLKLLGVGRLGGFHPAPNFGVYSVLATWDSMDEARRHVFESRIYRRYQDRAVESWVVFLSAARAHGAWDRRAPFAVESSLDAEAPVGVLTRATISWRRLLTFWRSVPRVAAHGDRAPSLRFSIGMGELPFVQLMTFSLWDDLAAARAFAYRDGDHRDTMRRARAEGWFAEELFVRFRVLETTGTWFGVDPLAERATPRPRELSV